MSYFELALQTKEAKEAIGTGVTTWLFTGNLNSGIDAMFKTGEKNGSLFAVRLGFLVDIVKKIFG